jgi:hypothetical protein
MVRRIITGERDGRSVVLSDEPVANTHEFTTVPGFRTTFVWKGAAVPVLPYNGVDPTATVTSMVPDPLGSTLIVVQFPPDSVFIAPGFDGLAAGAEQAQFLPGLADAFEPDGSGMHRTATVDYDIILDGELWLDLDDGELRHLKAGDIVIQNGTRHAWRNCSDKPATMAAVLIGAGN